VKVIFCGVQQISGEKKDGSGSYAFCQLLYLVPILNVNQPKRSVRAYGMEQASIDLDPSSLDEFADCLPGIEIQVVVSPNPQNLQRNIVTCLGK
jgi:hypothetical protein